MVHSALFPEGSYLGRLHKEGYLGSLMPSEPLEGGNCRLYTPRPQTLPQTQISAKIGKDQMLGSGRGKGQGGRGVEEGTASSATSKLSLRPWVSSGRDLGRQGNGGLLLQPWNHPRDRLYLVLY